MFHIALHFALPLVVARTFFARRWKRVAFVLMATLLVDVDHLLADPIYDAERCSIGFHPLHTVPAITVYAILFVVSWAVQRRAASETTRSVANVLHLVGLGLLIHMALDGLDCWL